jgi:hypothetical protein
VLGLLVLASLIDGGRAHLNYNVANITQDSDFPNDGFFGSCSNSLIDNRMWPGKSYDACCPRTSPGSAPTYFYLGFYGTVYVNSVFVVNSENDPSVISNINGAEIHVGYNYETWLNANSKCATLSGTGMYSCQKSGTFLKIELNDVLPLFVCEIQIWSYEPNRGYSEVY